MKKHQGCTFSVHATYHALNTIPLTPSDAPGTVLREIGNLSSGLSCLWNGVSFQNTLRLYTIAPLVIIASFILPVLLAVARGYSPFLHGEQIEARWTEVLDKFWTSVMFLLFAVYPVVSITTMRAFNCDINFGLLKDDYREICPSIMSFTSIYSGCFFVLYPVGIPVFMHCSLR
jgi:hypothetical protein